MKHLLSWLLWCIKVKEILPIEVGMVGHRKLTKKEKEYPLTSGMWRKYLEEQNSKE